MFTVKSRRAVRIPFSPRFSRFFSEKSVTSTETKTNPPGRIAGFFSRVSSFFVGAGLSALVSQYFIFEELRVGNKIVIEKQKEIEKRLNALQK